MCAFLDTSCVRCIRLLSRSRQLQLSSTTIRVHDLKVLQSTGLLSAVQAWCGPGKAARRRYLLDSARACCLRRGVRLVVAYLFCCVVAYISCTSLAVRMPCSFRTPPISVVVLCCTVVYCVRAGGLPGKRFKKVLVTKTSLTGRRARAREEARTRTGRPNMWPSLPATSPTIGEKCSWQLLRGREMHGYMCSRLLSSP